MTSEMLPGSKYSLVKFYLGTAKYHGIQFLRLLMALCVLKILNSVLVRIGKTLIKIGA